MCSDDDDVDVDNDNDDDSVNDNTFEKNGSEKVVQKAFETDKSQTIGVSVANKLWFRIINTRCIS